MNIVGWFFLLLGIFGLGYIIVGASLVALISSIITLKIFKKNKQNHASKKIKFEALIAAYNEEVNLPITLLALENVQKSLAKYKQNIEFSAFVGLDHCTDESLQRVFDFQKRNQLKVKYFENQGSRGKWFIIKQLIQKSDADWVALTDCAAVWHEDILKAAENLLNSEDIFCIAPSYLPDNAGFLETAYWRMEQFLRTLENFARGSIFVHGPTVFYRRDILLKALELLGEKHWINDDVVIPLVLKHHFKNLKVHYMASSTVVAWVRDRGVVSDVQIEKKRRRRILIGNLQCVFDIIFPRFNLFSVTSLTSVRIVFKLLWAYWLTFIAFGGVILFVYYGKDFISSINWSLELGLLVSMGFFSLLIFIYRSNYVHRLFMAYLSGLQIHKAVNALKDPKKIVWS